MIYINTLWLPNYRPPESNRLCADVAAALPLIGVLVRAGLLIGRVISAVAALVVVSELRRRPKPGVNSPKPLSADIQACVAAIQNSRRVLVFTRRGSIKKLALDYLRFAADAVQQIASMLIIKHPGTIHRSFRCAVDVIRPNTPHRELRVKAPLQVRHPRYVLAGVGLLFLGNGCVAGQPFDKGTLVGSVRTL